MNSSLYEDMYTVEQAHWWFQARLKIVRSLLARYLTVPAGQRAKLVDLGCGCGMMLAELAKDYDCVGMDAFDEAIEFCRQRGISVEKGFLPDQIPFASEQADAVLFLDVLEHLDHDAESVKAAARLLRPGGIMISTSPAYQWMWTARDDHHHHRRRYVRKSFRKLFEIDSLKVEFSSYANTFLFPLAAAERIYRKIRPLKSDESDTKVPAAPVNAVFRETFAAERGFLGRVPLPFGLSVVCVARKV